jgi:hypothetical protein
MDPSRRFFKTKNRRSQNDTPLPQIKNQRSPELLFWLVPVFLQFPMSFTDIQPEQLFVPDLRSWCRITEDLVLSSEHILKYPRFQDILAKYVQIAHFYWRASIGVPGHDLLFNGIMQVPDENELIFGGVGFRLINGLF